MADDKSNNEGVRFGEVPDAFRLTLFGQPLLRWLVIIWFQYVGDPKMVFQRLSLRQNFRGLMLGRKSELDSYL